MVLTSSKNSENVTTVITTITIFEILLNLLV